MHETKHFESENRWHQTCLIALCANENTKKREEHAIRDPKGRTLCPRLPQPLMEKETLSLAQNGCFLMT